MSAATTQVLDAPAELVGVGEAWRPSARGWSARIGILVAIFGGILLLTAIVPQFWADRFALAATWAMIGLSLNVIMGYTGQVSLGHHGFIGVAAFMAAWYATEQAGCPADACPLGSFATATAIAVLTGGIAAGLLGLVALRIKGLYLALITLAYGFVAESSIFELPELTRGGAGMPAPRPEGFVSDRAFAYLAYFFLALMLFVDWRLVRSKVGRAVISIKNSEAVASSYGINVTSYKIFAFIISGLFAGLAGSLFAFRTTNVVANDFTFATALLWVLMVVVGGLGNRTGVVIGSAFFALFPFLLEISEGMKVFIEDTLNRSSFFFNIVLGALLATLTIVSFPGGIAQQISPITRWLSGHRFEVPHHGEHKPKEPRRRLRERVRARKEEDTPLEALRRISSPADGETSIRGTTASTSESGEKVVRGEWTGPGKYADISGEAGTDGDARLFGKLRRLFNRQGAR